LGAVWLRGPATTCRRTGRWASPSRSRSKSVFQSRARRTLSCLRREACFVLIRPVRRPIDGGGVTSLACRSPGPDRSTCEKVADVHCGVGSCGVPRPRLGGYVTGMGPMDGATAAGGRSSCLSSASR
jgi:hypothetical protein